MESTLHKMDQENFELGVFQEIKVMDGIHTQDLSV